MSQANMFNYFRVRVATSVSNKYQRTWGCVMSVKEGEDITTHPLQRWPDQ
jgi:hypothetical protein